MPHRAFVLSIGDELVFGRTVDTNATHISSELAAAGCVLVAHATAPDDQPLIEKAMQRAMEDADLIVISGGIGPTPDDLTRQSLANVLGKKLVRHQSWVDHLDAFFKKIGREMKPGNLQQADVPEGAELLENPAGTAAGIRAERDGKTIFVVPGVPREMKAMLQKHVLPWVRQTTGGRAVKMRALHTFGVGESDLAHTMGDLLARDRQIIPGVSIGTTASNSIVSIRLYAEGASEAEARGALDSAEAKCREVLEERYPHLVFGVDDESLPDVVARRLRDHRTQPILSLAESCTGGLIAKLITDISGSSAHFHRGIVSYSNQAKVELLGVPRELINEHGAVSEPVVLAMAEGVRGMEGNGIALAVSGIAGPGGGTPEKPVGTVCLALVTSQIRFARAFNFSGDRDMVRLRSAYMALTLLRYHLMDVDPKDLPF